MSEELVFRGFLIPALDIATSSLPLAVLLSCVIFGLLHSYQGMIGILRTGLIGLVRTIPFLLTGSLLPSMLAHGLRPDRRDLARGLAAATIAGQAPVAPIARG